ncbi:MAG: hypothetical protein ACLTTH_16355 [Holdemanella porci]
MYCLLMVALETLSASSGHVMGVTHQMEQIKINGYTCDEVFLKMSDLKQVTECILVL